MGIQPDVGSLEQVKLHICADIAFVSDDAAIMTVMLDILDVVQVVNACLRHRQVIGMYDIAKSADYMQLIAKEISALRCAVAKVRCFLAPLTFPSCSVCHVTRGIPRRAWNQYRNSPRLRPFPWPCGHAINLYHHTLVSPDSLDDALHICKRSLGDADARSRCPEEVAAIKEHEAVVTDRCHADEVLHLLVGHPENLPRGVSRGLHHVSQRIEAPVRHLELGEYGPGGPHEDEVADGRYEGPLPVIVVAGDGIAHGKEVFDSSRSRPSLTASSLL